MSITGLVARSHSVRSFSNPDGIYQSVDPIAQGSLEFSARVAVRIEALLPAAIADVWYAGAYDGALGWVLGRRAGSPLTFFVEVFSGSGAVLDVPILETGALERTFDVAFTVGGGTLSLYVNGALVSSTPCTGAQSTTPFEIGGRSAGGYDPCTDAIVGVGYEDVLDTPATLEALFSNFRKNGEFRPDTMEYVWNPRYLHPANETIAAPPIWINTGIASPLGALSWLGSVNPLVFEDDPNPMFTADGAQGPQGPQGPQGIEGGPQGPQGFQGDTGSQGPQGFQGDTGPQGAQGDAGPQGFQGAQGFQGIQGPQGFQGAQGPQGDTGSQGPQGFQGAQGADAATPTTDLAVGTTSGPTRSATTFAVLDEMTITRAFSGKSYLVDFSCSFAFSATLISSHGVEVAVFVDGVQVSNSTRSAQVSGVALTVDADELSTCTLITPAAGNHTVDVRWRRTGTNAVNVTAVGTQRTLRLVEAA